MCWSDCRVCNGSMGTSKSQALLAKTPGTSQTTDINILPPKYHPRLGFVVEWDYVLHLPANYT